MKNTKTIYHFVVDKSGSMSGLENQTIEGFNTQLNTIKELKKENQNNEYIVSVTFFEHVVIDQIKFGKVEDIPLLNRDNYIPGTSTSLLDAIGFSIQSIEQKFQKEINEDEASVVMVILTDGEENSSKSFTYEEISAKIEILTTTNKWLFTFLGAGINARPTTDRLKIRPENVVSFERSEYTEMLNRVSNSVRNYERSKTEGSITLNFFDENFD
jgi:hypothetical protein